MEARKERTITRRVLFAAGAVAGLPAALVACTAGATGGAGAGAPAKQAGTVHVLNANWGELYDDLMAKIGDEFTKETGVTVEWDFAAGADEKLMTLSAAGTPPDASYTSWATQGTLAARGVLSPLDDYLKKAGLTRKDFSAAMVDVSTYQGKLYALPGGADWLVNHWSKTAYAEVGLDPEKPPKTFAELEQHSEKLLKSGPDGYTRVGYWPGPGGASFMYVAYFFGGEFYDASAGKVTANHPKVVEALEWLVSYGKKMDYTKMTAFWKDQPSYSKAGSPFSQGKAAYLFQGFWSYEPLDRFAPQLKYGLAPWPTPTGSAAELSRNVIQGWPYAIPKGTKQPDLGWQFIKYAFVDNSAKMGYLTLNGPCYLKQLDDFAKRMTAEVLKPDNRMTPYFKVFIDVARAGTKHFPSLPITNDYQKALNAAFNDAMAGNKVLRAALDEVTQTMQAQLDQVLKG